MMFSSASTLRMMASVFMASIRAAVAASVASARSFGRKCERSVDATTRTFRPRQALARAAARVRMVDRVWAPMTMGTMAAPGRARWTNGTWTSTECSSAKASGRNREPVALASALARPASTRAVPRGVANPPSGQIETPSNAKRWEGPMMTTVSTARPRTHA